MRTIETERLVLRRFGDEDAADMHALFSDGEAMRLVGMLPRFTEPTQTQERIFRWKNSDRRLAIALKESGSVIGYIAVNPDSEEDREDTRELGFALAAPYRGNGYMAEAVRGVLAVLRESGIRYIWACCFAENKASERLIRSLGFDLIQEGSYDAPNDRTYRSLEFRTEL